MKTSLDHLPADTCARLHRLTEMVRAALPAAEAVILFGSYARGDYVVDGQWNDYHPEPSHYQSDYDVAVLTAPEQDGKHADHRLKNVKDAFEREYGREIPVQFHRFGVMKFNRMVKQHRFFFLDIADEGILLHDSGRYVLGAKRTAPWYPVVLKWARQDWRKKRLDAISFMAAAETVGALKNYTLADFQLHQACESWYLALMLVITEYRPKTHDLRTLRSLTLPHGPAELDAAFPLATAADRRRFQVIWDGYIRGRYDRNFMVSKADYLWLAAGTERLAKAARQICLARIRDVARLAKEQEGQTPPDGEDAAVFDDRDD